MKLSIFGASGSGTTTLGKKLAQLLDCKHLDADDYYWEPTDPPYQHKVPLDLRNARITKDFESNLTVIISGSMVSWGKHWESAFDLAVFLYVPHALRMERLKKRETQRYGDLLYTDKAVISNHEAFLQWAAQYDDESFDGRSLKRHEQWMEQLLCPTLRIEGDTTVMERTKLVLERIHSMGYVL